MSWICAKICLAVVVCLGAVSLAGAAGELKLYVSPTGKDTASGKAALAKNAAGPFLTLERAREEIRRLKQAGRLPSGIVVELQPGTYELARPFALTAEDSGTPGCPITYCAKPGGGVRLVGGKVLRGFESVTDPALLGRLDPAARGKVMQVDLKALGITDFGAPSGGWGQNTDNRLELFFNEEPMTIARWPNQG
ncbi:MAG: phage tail protein, partial [Armatimonadota bacterium]